MCMKKVFSIITLIIILILGGLIYLFLMGDLMVFRIKGTSMTPLLYQNDLVISFKMKEYKRKDIVVFNYNNSKSIKRVIGLPNEKIDIKDKKVYIDGEELKEEYISVPTDGEELQYPYLVESNKYFVLGDNRVDSLDSRYFKIQGINKEEVLGKVFFSITNFKFIK